MSILKNEPEDSLLFTNVWNQSVPGRNGKFLRNDVYHTLIYPGWDPKTLVAPKPKNLILSERDNWFWKQNFHTNKSVKNAQSGIKEFISRVGSYWLNDKRDVTKGVKGCINAYNLE